MLYKKESIQQLEMFVLVSFLAGMLNFFDTFLRLIFFYMLPGKYPLGVSLKPFFFILQALCFSSFVIYLLRKLQKLHVYYNFYSLLSLQLTIFVITIFLFVLYQFAYPGKYGLLAYTELIWIACYVVGTSSTSFWFSLKLKQNYQQFSIIFLLVGFTFLTNFLSEIYLMSQTILSYQLPLIVDQVGTFVPPVLMVLVLFYTWIYFTLRKRKKVSLTTILKFLTVLIALVFPFFLNGYKEGLINMITQAIVSWGLGYSGYEWYYTSIYLASLITYLFLIVDLTYLSDPSTSNLILLGVISFPWNGIMIFEFGYSSIVGNMLSLDAIILGFFMLGKHDLKKDCKEDSKVGLSYFA